MIENLTFNVAQLQKEAVGATRTGQVVAGLYRLVPEIEELAAPAALPADRDFRQPETTTERRESDDQETSGPVLTGSVRLMHTQGGVMVQGHLHAQATLSCSRCLEPVGVPLDIDLEEIFTPTIDVVTGRPLDNEEEDRALWIDERHILDLSEVLRQDVLLTLPMHALCRDDCRGLCPTCGQNLNQGSCNCKPEPDPRWTALLDLLKE